MKRVLCIILAGMMLLLCACATGEQGITENTESTEAATVATSEQIAIMPEGSKSKATN